MGTGESGLYYTSGGSELVHHDALIHCIDGSFTHNPKTGRPERLKSGGHGQSCLEIMEANGIDFNIVGIYSNGVRVGNVPDHKSDRKRRGIAQVWFPKEWKVRDIVKAGEHIAGLRKNADAPDGLIMWGTYKGVKVGAIKTNGRIATIFPNEQQAGPLAFRRMQ